MACKGLCALVGPAADPAGPGKPYKIHKNIYINIFILFCPPYAHIVHHIRTMYFDGVQCHISADKAWNIDILPCAENGLCAVLARHAQSWQAWPGLCAEKKNDAIYPRT